MAKYTFRFFFAEMDESRRFCEVSTWGGHLGTAISRAWKDLKRAPAYKSIKGLRPTSIEIAPAEHTKARSTGNKWMGTGDYKTKVEVGA